MGNILVGLQFPVPLDYHGGQENVENGWLDEEVKDTTQLPKCFLKKEK